MSMSVNVHMNSAKNVVVEGYGTENQYNRGAYGVIRIQNEQIDVSMFVDTDNIDLLIKQLQKAKRQIIKIDTQKQVQV